ncbi:MAG: DUF6186 family protein [Acidimicrobiales bacterium]
MSVAVVWALIGVLVLVAEARARTKDRWCSLAVLGAKIASYRFGRICLVASWAFVGWHLFARYTVPPL